MPTLLHRRSHAAVPAALRPRDAILNDLTRVEQFPTLSEATVRAIAAAQNVDTPIEEISVIIRRDAVVATAILRRANNWMLGGRAVNDLKTAIVRLGLTECVNILCTFGVLSLYKDAPPAVQRRCDTLQKHSLFVAILASSMCRELALGMHREAFTAGLFHDIGRLIASVRAPDEATAADPLDFDETGDILRHEREVLGVDHSAIGYQFATANDLPETVTRTILNHHRPAEERIMPLLVALVATADRVANHAQREHKIDGYDLAFCPFFELLNDHVDRSRAVKLRDRLQRIIVDGIRQTRKMLALIPKSSAA